MQAIDKIYQKIKLHILKRIIINTNAENSSIFFSFKCFAREDIQRHHLETFSAALPAFNLLILSEREKSLSFKSLDNPFL